VQLFTMASEHDDHKEYEKEEKYVHDAKCKNKELESEKEALKPAQEVSF
jgi:hypothetical protein